MSDSLWPHGLEKARLCYPSLSLWAFSNSCPLSQWCHPSILSCWPLILLPSIFPSINVFFNNSAVPIRWPKFRTLSFSIRTSNEYSEFISSRVDWYDILAVKGSLKSLFQHQNSKGSTLKHSAFFMLHLSHLYMTTGKNRALTTQTFLGKVVSF